MTSQEAYELLCVPDITFKELRWLLNVIESMHKRIHAAEFQWLLNKAIEVKDEVVARDSILDDLKRRAKENKTNRRALPPADNSYTDYTQSE